MKLSNCFMSVTDYLNKVGDYINQTTFNYLLKLKDSHKVLVNGNNLWFDDDYYIDEIFRPTLIIPKYLIDNLRVIINNNLIGVSLSSSFCAIKPVGLIASVGKLIEYDMLDIRWSNPEYIGLIGKQPNTVINNICGTTISNTSVVQSNPVNATQIEPDSTNTPIGNATNYILNHWFTEEELLLLDKVSDETMSILYNLKTIDSFVNIATQKVYSKVFLDSASPIMKENGVTFDGDRGFNFNYNGVDFNFTVCYNTTTSKLFIKTFSCDDKVEPRLKVYVEGVVADILANADISITNEAKTLNTVINILQDYANDLYEKLIKSCPMGKDDYLSVIRNYPLHLITGNVDSVINQILVDYYSNKE